MKKKWMGAIAAVVLLIAVLSIVFFKGKTPEDEKNGEQKEQDLNFEKIAEFDVPALLALDDDVQDDDRDICITQVAITDDETIYYLVWEVSKLTSNLMSDDYYIYKISKQNGKYEQPVAIDTQGYSIGYFAWSGDKIYFMENSEQENVRLFYGEIQENKLVNVQELVTEDNVRFCEVSLAVKDDLILFSAYDVDLITPSCYIGKISGNTISTLDKLEFSEEYESVSSAEFLPGEQAIVYCTNYIDTDDDDWSLCNSIHYVEYEQTEAGELALGKVMSPDIDEVLKNLDVDNNLVQIYTNENSNTAYAIYINESVLKLYRADFSLYMEKVAKSAQDMTKEGKSYTQGDRSYDEYDTSDFELKLRNKSDESKKQGVYYEIFVRSFADSDGDGVGDFNGITQKLDYLSDLGIDGIWLMPINASDSYHGYDVVDFTALNSEYGTEEDFVNLLNEAHARGIKVIMDFPINHTSSSHPWFLQALEGDDNPYRNYYRWVDENDTEDFSKSDTAASSGKVWYKEGDAYYYAIFGSYMPDLNYNNPDVRSEIKEAAAKWLNLGVDGFRLDAAMHIYGQNEFKQMENPTEATIQWWNEFALFCEEINPDVYLVGECWQNDELLEEYVQPFDSKFNFAFELELISAIQKGQAQTQDGMSLSDYMSYILEKYQEIDENYMDAVFTTNHDQDRLMSQLGNEEKARLAATVTLTLSGNPFLYYGEELGMYGTNESGDETRRTPFLWDDNSQGSYNTTWYDDTQNQDTPSLQEQEEDADSMYNFYKKLIRIRKNNSALSSGDFENVDFENESIMAYNKTDENQRLLVIHNFSDATQTIDLSGKNLSVIYDSQENISSGENVDNLELAAYESVILLYN